MKPFLLLILDGFGISPDSEFNAISKANTPTWDRLWQHYPHALLDASGKAVGLPDQQIGNSEVGHMTIGAGRTLYQELTRIDAAIQDQSIAEIPIIQDSIRLGQTHPIHIMGLLSPGGVHSHESHFFALVRLLAQAHCQTIYVHAFLDGRDVLPKSARSSLEKLEALCQTLPQVKIASVMGRYYAMDRDSRWDRIEIAYDALTLAKTPYHAENALDALAMAYARNESDEFVKPTWIGKAPAIQDEDLVFFINFRSDRARQLSYAFLQKDFTGFMRKKILTLSAFVSMTEYAKNIPSSIIFPPQDLHNTLGEYLAGLGKTQLRIAETEKYAHVTFFFNGGKEAPFVGEERLLIPSPKVATYDLQPEMNAPLLTEKLVAAILSQQYDVIICNFANPDMVGHSGNFAATVKAIEVIDVCLAKIDQALSSVSGEMLITADHGNADCMFDSKTKQAHTAHTTALVPLLYVGAPATVIKPLGNLADIAPSLLTLMGLAVPKEMTGDKVFVCDKR